MARFPWRLSAVVSLFVGVVVGCSSGGDGNGGTGPQPGTIAIGVAPASLTLVQGQGGSITVALTRGGSFTGSVTLSAAGMPSGVTLAGATIAASSSSAELTVNASASAAVGAATVTITAAGTGVIATTAALSLTIQISAENGYNPSISVPSVDVTQGASQSVTIDVNRESGFAGAVTFSARDVPNGYQPDRQHPLGCETEDPQGDELEERSDGPQMGGGLVRGDREELPPHHRLRPALDAQSPPRRPRTSCPNEEGRLTKSYSGATTFNCQRDTILVRSDGRHGDHRRR